MGDKFVEERFEERSEAVAAPDRRLGRVTLVSGSIAVFVTLATILLAAPPLWLAAVVATIAAAGAALATWLLARPRPVVVPHRAIVLRGTELSFDPGNGAELTAVLDLATTFGVTLLANRARTRATLVVSQPDRTFYVGATIDETERVACKALLASAYTVASDERALDAAAPDGTPLHLSADAFARLHAALLRLDPLAGARMFLSDARGRAIVLEGQRLTVGERLFDLATALEWRGMLFRESGFGGGVAVYQGTYVRQASNEVVFVSLMPALSAPTASGDMLTTAEPTIERAVLRDMSLMHEAAEEPPAPELRVAVERVFMMPLRAALNGARTRLSSSPDSVRRDRPLRA